MRILHQEQEADLRDVMEFVHNWFEAIVEGKFNEIGRRQAQLLERVETYRKRWGRKW